MIGEIENAILARLKAASDAGVLGYKWATLETYPANWDEYLKDKTIRAPGAWAVFGGFGSGQPLGFGRVRLKADFGVVVMAENMRNETAQRHGGVGAAEPGSYQLAMDAIALLQGQSLGLDIDAFEVHALHFVRTQAITASRKISMLAIELSTHVTIAGASVDTGQTIAPGSGQAIGDFSKFHANWELPGFATVDADPAAPGVQLPDDAHAAATDHVLLESPNP